MFSTPKQTKRIIIRGFALASTLLAFLLIFTWMLFDLSYKQSREIQFELDEKLLLANEMRSDARERALLLHMIMASDDAFLREDHREHFHYHASNFMSLLGKLRAMGLNPEEQVALEIALENAGRAQEVQNRVIALLDAENFEQASQVFNNQTHDLQQAALASLDALVNVEKSRIKDEKASADKSRNSITATIAALFLMTVAITVFISYKVQQMIVKSQEKIVSAQEKAELATQAKSEFLANMSHELRTPMNGVLGTLTLLHNTHLDQEQEELTEIALNSSEVLLSILNDILDFSKIEAGKLALEETEINLRETIEEVVQLLALPAQAKKLEINCDIHPEVPDCIIIDSVRLRQIITNLLSNAIKFTEKGHILISVTNLGANAHTARLRFSVHDSGIGIAEQKQKHIFDSFQQADSSTTRHFGGTGLGLSISKNLVELMHGEIGVQSIINKGSQFWFSLPLAYTDKKQDLSPLDFYAQAPRILIVDEHVRHRNAIIHMLTHWQLPFQIHHSLDKALMNINQRQQVGSPYSLILLDQDSFEKATAAQLVELNHGKRHEVLVMTPDINLTQASRHDLELKTLHKPLSHSTLYNTLINTAYHFSPAIQLPTDFVTDDEELNKQQHILVAEDNPVNQKVAEKLLSKFGYKVSIVENGEQAVDAVKNGDFQLIFMDCQMPVMNGYDATQQIRQLSDKDKSNVCIIALTANAMEGDKQKCLDAGMDAYLAKPLKISELKEQLSRWQANSYSKHNS